MPATPAPFERFVQFRRYLGVGFTTESDLCYTTDLSGQFNLWRQPSAPGGEPGYPRLLTGYTDLAVREFSFADDGRSVFYQADRDGDENYQLYRLWLKEGRTETLTDEPKVQHQLVGGTVPVRGNELVYTDNGREATDVDVVVRDLTNGATSRPFPTGMTWGDPKFDRTRGRILAQCTRTRSDAGAVVLDRKHGRLTEILPHPEEAIVSPIDFTNDGGGILLLTDLESDFVRIVLHLPGADRTKVIAAPKADVEQVAYSRQSGVLAYAVNEEGFSSVYTGRIGTKFRRQPTPRGAVEFTLWGRQFELSDDGQALAALWSTGKAPPEILRIPVSHGPARTVTDGMIGVVPGAPLPPPRVVRVPAEEGRHVPCLWYAPKRRSKEPMPAVLSIHGGPHLQDRPGWHYGGLHQYLNSRGISVLCPNYRGSLGYGRRYRELLYRDWGGVDLEDFRACAEWLQAREEVDPARLAVFGASYGGFASLSCLTRLPQYWKVGVDGFGPSNLVTFLQSIPPSWKRILAQMLGDPERDREFLLSRSPITYLDNLRADLLVIQGGKDPRVVQAESDQLVQRLRAAGRTVQYLVFPDEGHGFTRYANTIRASRTSAQFLTEHLLPSAATGR